MWMRVSFNMEMSLFRMIHLVFGVGSLTKNWTPLLDKAGRPASPRDLSIVLRLR